MFDLIVVAEKTGDFVADLAAALLGIRDDLEAVRARRRRVNARRNGRTVERVVGEHVGDCGRLLARSLLGLDLIGRFDHRRAAIRRRTSHCGRGGRRFYADVILGVVAVVVVDNKSILLLLLAHQLHLLVGGERTERLKCDVAIGLDTNHLLLLLVLLLL